MTDWSRLATEQRNRASEHIDELSTIEMLRVINLEDAVVVEAVRAELEEISKAVEATTAALRRGDRLFYIGAGTSGRLGILDAAECPPTFGTDPGMVQGLIAGGREAVFRSVEGAEDDVMGAVTPLREHDLSKGDVVVGIAASGVTPFVIGGLEFARDTGCFTILVSSSQTAASRLQADAKIVPDVGPEVIAGSTRMKAGTATKLVLNMISTASMVGLGKTFGNLMVDLQPRNAKLRDRCVRILCQLADLEQDVARQRLERTGWNLKLSVTMEMCGVDETRARLLLADSGGRVKDAVRASAAETAITLK